MNTNSILKKKDEQEYSLECIYAVAVYIHIHEKDHRHIAI
jgi:hypothetical protein